MTKKDSEGKIKGKGPVENLEKRPANSIDVGSATFQELADITEG